MKTHPISEHFPMLEGDEWSAFVDSIRRNGQREPIVVYDGKILDGRNRYKACVEIGIEPKLRTLGADENPWEFVWDENAHRRHLAQGQRVAIKIAFLRGSDAWTEAERKRKEATREKRATAGRMLGGRPDPSVSRDTRGSVEPIRERVEIAKAAGVSPATVGRALALESKAPELFADVAAGKLELGKALGEVKLREKYALAEKLRAEPLPAPTGPYRVIVSDPPWRYESRVEDHTHRGRNPYPDMTIEEICALPVQALAHNDAVLWLWTTNAFMRQAYQCLDAWGFVERTILTWAKDRMGTGDWLRGQTEHCILAVRGKPLVTLTNQTTILHAKLREHSRKPDEFYALVEALCPGNKLEMFARAPRAGWAAWGAETGKFDAA